VSTQSRSAAAAGGERTCAPGKPPKSRAQVTRYAAHHPFTHETVAASGGAIGLTSAQTSARTSSGATTGAAAAFAGTVSNGIW